MADIYQEEVENNDNFTADNLDNIEIPQSEKRKRIADDVPAGIWKELTGDEIDSDEPVHLYRFYPVKPPGIQPDENSITLTCFQALFTDDIQDICFILIVRHNP